MEGDQRQHSHVFKTNFCCFSQLYSASTGSVNSCLWSTAVSYGNHCSLQLIPCYHYVTGVLIMSCNQSVHQS